MESHGVSWETILGVIAVVGFLATLVGVVSKMKDDLTGVETRSRAAMEQQEEKIRLEIQKEAAASQLGYNRLEARLNDMVRDTVTREQFEAAQEKLSATLERIEAKSDARLDRVSQSLGEVREAVAALRPIRAAE